MSAADKERERSLLSDLKRYRDALAEIKSLHDEPLSEEVICDDQPCDTCTEGGYHEIPVCAECGKWDDYYRKWPCPTYQKATVALSMMSPGEVT